MMRLCNPIVIIFTLPSWPSAYLINPEQSAGDARMLTLIEDIECILQMGEEAVWIGET